MSSEPIERFAAEADDARARIASTIDEIQDRLDPRRMVSESFERVAGGALQMASTARTVARSHPLALAAAAAAIGLALLARNRLANATVDLGDDHADYTDYDDGYGYSELPVDSAAPTTSRPAAAQRMQAVAVQAGDSAAANPILAIFAGLAAGAAMGALFPSSEAERRVLGDTGARLGATARRAVSGIGSEMGSVLGGSLGNFRR